jgi:poly(3-hydroxybutyrate) depolymerase
MRVFTVASVAMIFLCIGCPSGRSAAAGERTGNRGQSEQMFEKEVSRTVRLGYLLYLPEGYDRDKEQKWPLVLFLHGAGERGKDLRLVKKHGPPLIEGARNTLFIVVPPQCPTESWWPEQVDCPTALLDDVQSRRRPQPCT